MGRDGQCVPEQMLPASVCLSLGALIWSVKGIRVCRETELRDDAPTASPGCLQLSRGNRSLGGLEMRRRNPGEHSRLPSASPPQQNGTRLIISPELGRVVDCGT